MYKQGQLSVQLASEKDNGNFQYSAELSARDFI